MKIFSSLQRRIVVAYLLLAFGSSALFAVIAAIAVEGIEVRLVDERLESVAAWASARHAGHLPVEMPTGLNFQHGDNIPKSLLGLAPGVHEIMVGGVGFHVLVGHDALGRYVVVDHDSDYEAVEWVVYSMLAAAIVVFLTLSFFFGRYVANRIVNPITELAAAVRQTESESDLPLLQNDDEMGVLARAFAARSAQARQFLDRERFFTGDVSHELRTPLTVITGAAELLVAQTAGQPALYAPAERILRSANEAADCVTALLLLARSPQLLDAPATPMQALIKAEVERYQFLVQGKPVHLTCTAENDFSVHARRELLSVAIGNLIRNACLYTEQGSVAIRIHGRSVTIEDTGPGIPSEVLARLQGTSSTTKRSGSAGSGLGLGLVQRVCERLGATLHVRCSDSCGTAFSVEFPQDLTES